MMVTPTFQQFFDANTELVAERLAMRSGVLALCRKRGLRGLMDRPVPKMAAGANSIWLRRCVRRCAVTSCSAQKLGGNRAKTPASPSSCMTRSERMAPIGPSRLRVAAPVAWVRLGSAADHVSRLMPPAPHPSSTSNPNILQSQPVIASRNEDGSNGGDSSLRYAIPARG